MIFSTVARATWLYQEYTGNVTDDEIAFTPSTDGTHYHQAVAPTTGDIDTGVFRYTTRYSRVQKADGDCGRVSFSVPPATNGGWKVISDVTISSGSAKFWVCGPSLLASLPTCSEN